MSTCIHYCAMQGILGYVGLSKQMEVQSFFSGNYFGWNIIVCKLRIGTLKSIRKSLLPSAVWELLILWTVCYALEYLIRMASATSSKATRWQAPASGSSHSFFPKVENLPLLTSTQICFICTTKVHFSEVVKPQCL